jgi:hypothetical protein
MKLNNIKRVINKSDQGEPQALKTILGKRLKPAPQNPMDGSNTQLNEGNKRRKLCNKINNDKEYRRKKVTPQKTLRNRPTTNKIGPRGMLIRRGWHYYLRHIHRSRYRVKKKHKLDSTKSPHPKRNRR